MSAGVPGMKGMPVAGGDFQMQESGLLLPPRPAVNFRTGLTATDDSRNQRINVDRDPLLWSENFSDPAGMRPYDVFATMPLPRIVDKTAQSYANNVLVGAIVPNLYVGDNLQQIKFTVPTIANEAATTVTLLASFIDSANYVLGQYEWSLPQIAIYTVELGAVTVSQGFTTGVTRPTAGQSRWIRVARIGDLIRMHVYTTDPETEPAPTPQAELNAANPINSATRSARFGAMAKPRRVGFYLAIPAGNWLIDDYKVWA